MTDAVTGFKPIGEHGDLVPGFPPRLRPYEAGLKRCPEVVVVPLPAVCHRLAYQQPISTGADGTNPAGGSV